jgi:hypothetical protein
MQSSSTFQWLRYCYVMTVSADWLIVDTVHQSKHCWLIRVTCTCVKRTSIITSIWDYIWNCTKLNCNTFAYWAKVANILNVIIVQYYVILIFIWCFMDTVHWSKSFTHPLRAVYMHCIQLRKQVFHCIKSYNSLISSGAKIGNDFNFYITFQK